MNDFTKRSFTAGVISDSLRSRIDLNKFQTALAKCNNFIPLPEGGVVNRSGFQYIATDSKSSLIPFQFNQNDSYMLAFSDGLLNIYRYGLLVHSMPSPYSYEDITIAQYVQNADVITIAHIDHPLRTLTRFANNNWAFDDILFSSTQSPPTGLSVVTVGTDSKSASKRYDYVVTSVVDGKESGQSAEVSVTANALSETWGNEVSWAGTGDSFNVYKSVSPSTNVYGWIGNSKTNKFTDYNIAPVSSEGVVKQSTPFNTVDIELTTVSGSLSVGHTISNGNFSGVIQRINGTTYTLSDVTGSPVAGDPIQTTSISFSADNFDQALGISTGPAVLPIGSKLTIGPNSGVITSSAGNVYQADVTSGVFILGLVFEVSGSSVTHYKVNLPAGSPALVVGDSFSNSVVTGIVSSVSAVFGTEQTFTTDNMTGGVLSAGDNIYIGSNTIAVTSIYQAEASSYVWITSNPELAFDGVIVSVDDVSNPSVINQYQQRLILANTENNPQTVYASRTSDYYDFRKSEPVGDSDALEFTLASGQVNEIRHIVSMQDMLILTSSGVWKVTEGQNEVLTPSSVGVRRISHYGSSKVRPLLVGSSALFIEEKSARVRDIYSVNDYESEDVSILAMHLFRGHKIVSWCYQKEPHGVIWAVRDDGVLLGMTYHKQHQVWGWHTHDTQGQFISVNCVSETDVDSVYACVLRGTEYFIERLSYRMDDEYSNFTYLDSYVRVMLDDAAEVLSVPLHLQGRNIAAVADGFVYRFAAGEEVSFESAVDSVIFGLEYQSDLQTLEVDPEGANTSGKPVQVNKLSVRFQNTVGGWFGQEFDKQIEGRWRSRSDNYGAIALFSGDHTQVMSSGWDSHGKVSISQKDPLPMHILSITPTVVVGGR